MRTNWKNSAEPDQNEDNSLEHVQNVVYSQQPNSEVDYFQLFQHRTWVLTSSFQPNRRTKA